MVFLAICRMQIVRLKSTRLFKGSHLALMAFEKNEQHDVAHRVTNQRS